MAWETEAEILKLLSQEDIGFVPDSYQLEVADRTMNLLKTAGHIKCYDVKIRQTHAGERFVTIGWSRMLNFPSQSFSVRVSSLTRENLMVMDVMET